MEDIYHNILLLLPIKDIVNCRLVNKSFYKVSKLEILWKGILGREFRDSIIFKNNYYETVKFHILLVKLCKDIKYEEGWAELYDLQTLDLGCG